MRSGEKWILVAMGVSAGALGLWKLFAPAAPETEPLTIPFYSTAQPELAAEASRLYRRYNCRGCHTLWGVRDLMQAVPAPALDGIGSFRAEDWLYRYLSSPDPQSILPSRLKPQYRMPSFADIPASERKTLAAYLASLKVQPWYLDEVKHQECRKLTGADCPQ